MIGEGDWGGQGKVRAIEWRCNRLLKLIRERKESEEEGKGVVLANFSDQSL
jgi:hypothetical protein